MKGILEEIEVFWYFKEKCDEENKEKLNEIIDAYKGRRNEEVKEQKPVEKVQAVKPIEESKSPR